MVTKTVDRGVVLYADDVRYRVVIKNLSRERVFLYDIVDPLPKSFHYQAGSTSGSREPYIEYEYGPDPSPPCPTPPPTPTGTGICPFGIDIERETVHWRGRALDPGASIIIEFSARAFSDEPGLKVNNVMLGAGDESTQSGETAGVLLCGDLDGDRVIGASDAAAVRAALGEASPDLKFDLDEDGRVTGTDVRFATECAHLAGRGS